MEARHIMILILIQFAIKRHRTLVLLFGVLDHLSLTLISCSSVNLLNSLPMFSQLIGKLSWASSLIHHELLVHLSHVCILRCQIRLHVDGLYGVIELLHFGRLSGDRLERRVL